MESATREAIIDSEDPRRKARMDAEAWRVRLSVTRIRTETLKAFFAWRREPINRAAYEDAERAGQARAAVVEQAERDWKA
ncbi:hypothetical protein [Brevundimonas aurantiaca]|uniref:hypothetical protein n=1 Tax=Brevundimonas aurantiaca TaxID=74316 RepID=UPI00174A6900|nr:hypothetical protein [Brevundimonas aurantiaca]